MIQVRVKLGMAWPEEETMNTPWYLNWQLNAEASVQSRREDGGFQWIMLFIARAAFSGFVLINVFHFTRRKIPRLLGYGPMRKNLNRRKLERMV